VKIAQISRKKNGLGTVLVKLEFTQNLVSIVKCEFQRRQVNPQAGRYARLDCVENRAFSCRNARRHERVKDRVATPQGFP
jgi:hypothetical protein